ncbi:MAG: hypothetical protein MJY60_00385 [Bacteroidales bacterium]|nr:hypothetical protein [Bacteroidales bacterium]
MKIWKYIEYILLVLSLIIFIVFFVVNPTTQDAPMLDGYLGWAYILLAITLILALGFPLIRAFKSKKGIIGLLALIIGVVVICGGVYMLAPGTAIDVNTETTAQTFKFTDAALYLTYLFIGASVVAVIWSIIRSAIKN